MDWSTYNFVNTCEKDVSYTYASGTSQLVSSTELDYCYSPDRALYAISFLTVALIAVIIIVARWWR